MDTVAVRGRNSGRKFCLLGNEFAVWQKLPSISEEPAASISVLYPDGCSKFLRNDGTFHQTTRPHIPEDSTLHISAERTSDPGQAMVYLFKTSPGYTCEI